jgi:hypothetical protein
MTVKGISTKPAHVRATAPATTLAELLSFGSDDDEALWEWTCWLTAFDLWMNSRMLCSDEK